MDKELGEIRERRIVSVRAGGERSAGPGLGVSSALTFGGRWGGVKTFGVTILTWRCKHEIILYASEVKTCLIKVYFGVKIAD